jgi:hypothetical protein
MEERRIQRQKLEALEAREKAEQEEEVVQLRTTAETRSSAD